MGEDLNIGSILDESEINDLFGDNTAADDTRDKNKKSEESDAAKENEDNNVTEDSIEDLFGPESVGNESKNKNTDGKNGSSDKDGGTSPNNFSSIAKALKEDGPLSSVDDKFFDDIKDAQGFSDAIEEEVKNRLDDAQKRILDALDDNVDPDDIRQYERTLKWLDGIDDDAINDESDEGLQLRKALIYQDFINKGYSKEKATKMLDKSIEDGLDIEDAKDALAANKDYYKKSYKTLRDEARKEADAKRESYRKFDEDLKKSIMNDDEVIKGIGKLDNNVRKKAYESVSKGVYKDPDSGRIYTAVQKFEKDNPAEFRKMLGLVYALTDGYKSFDTLVKSKVNTEKKKGIAELERVINSTPRNNDGSYRLVGNTDDDNSFFNGIVSLDL